MPREDLTILERMRIQLEFAVPLIRDLQEALGKEAVEQALADRIARATAEAWQTPTPAGDLRSFAAGFESYAAGDALEYEVLASEEDRFEVDVTRCGYAALMEELDARDLGPLLVCNHDFPLALRLGARLERTQTCMTGASHCDFRYRQR